MNKKKINILIVEDSPISAEAYASIISDIPKFTIKIVFAKNCDEAVLEVKRNTFQLALLDLQLPVSKKGDYVCGEDIGLLIRKKNPKTKILIFTNITNQLRTQNIIMELDPEGFIIKTDVDYKSFRAAIINVLNGGKYYSNTIKIYSANMELNGIIIDDFDRRIMYHLSMGEKTKDISKFVPLCKRTIEERKSKLKKAFGIKNNNQSNIVKEAKKMGYI